MPVSVTRRRPALSVAERMSFAVDDLVGVFSPKAQLRRMRARIERHNMARIYGSHGERFAQQSYQGAERSHRLAGWVSGSGSADADLDQATLETLRDRSRERLRNTGLANSIITSIQENVVGEGLTPQLELDEARLGISKTEKEDLEGAAGELWETWSPHADSTDRLHMHDLQALVLASVLVNGDLGAMPIHVEQGRDPSPLGFKLELIEADRIATPWGAQDADARVVRNGVSLGRRGQPVAYWVQQEHPGDPDLIGERTFRRIKRRNEDGTLRFMHLFWQKRVGQSRGEPLFAPILANFKDLEDYAEAELVAAQVAAAFSVYVKSPSPTIAAEFETGRRPTGEREQEVVPGQIVYLDPGEEIDAPNPGRPNAGFEGFYLSCARQISSACGIPLEVAMRDFHLTTYSQARAALLEARRMFAQRQSFLIRYLLAPVWDRVLYEGWLRGLYPAGDFLDRRHLWTRTVWRRPGWGHIDEEKSMKAAQLALSMRVQSRAAIASQLHGGAWSDINRQIAREDEEIKAAGPAPEEPEADDEAETEDDEVETDDETEDEEAEEDAEDDE